MPTEAEKKKETAVKDEKPKGDGKLEDVTLPENDLSDEDLALKKLLEGHITTLQEASDGHKEAIEALSDELKKSTSSMTSVPKPFKFLTPLYDDIKAVYEGYMDGPLKTSLADLLSTLAMVRHDENRECLNFKLAGNKDEIDSWGTMYLRTLAGEVGDESKTRLEKEEPLDDLLEMLELLLPLMMKHREEADAVDLLLEMQSLEKIEEYCDSDSYRRVALYLLSCAHYDVDNDTTILKVVYKLYMKHEAYSDALRTAMRMNDIPLVKETFLAVEDGPVQRQLALMLGRSRIWFPLGEDGDEYDEDLGNQKLHEYFLSLGRELDVMEAKSPEDIYKSHLETVSRATTSNVDSALKNLASTFVNAFVNSGFQTDKLMTDIPDSEQPGWWVWKNSAKNAEHAMMSAVASEGMIHMWNGEEHTNELDRWSDSKEHYIHAGLMIAIGICNVSVRTDNEIAFAMIQNALESASEEGTPKESLLVGAAVGLAIAFAGAGTADDVEPEEDDESHGIGSRCMFVLAPMITSENSSVELIGMASLALGVIFAGSGNGAVTEALSGALMRLGMSEGSDDKDSPLKSMNAKFIPLAIGLANLGTQAEGEDVVLEIVRSLAPESLREFSVLTVQSCLYAGTGNVEKVRELLLVLVDHLTEEGQDASHQAVATLGIALIAMGEELGTEMVLRSFDHLLQYCEIEVKRAVPLALGLLCASNPQLPVMDTLSKLSHDTDHGVAQGAVFSLGVIGAGTNNARIAAMLRELAAYYSKEPKLLFVVRIAQGLLYMGKGTMSIAPTSDGVLSHVALSGLLAVFFGLLDFNSTILGKQHYLLYFFATAMKPRMLITLDENLEPLPVNVKVGKAVDTVGQAGKPKTITGFQTHTTPVLLAHGERAELVNEKYIALSSSLEGVVLLRPNSEWEDPLGEDEKK